MKQFFLKLFTWWNGQTFGTQLWTRRFGELVGITIDRTGQDEQTLPAPKLLPAQRHILPNIAPIEMNRGFVAQQLLDGG